MCVLPSHQFPGHEERIHRHAERVESEDPGRQPLHCWSCGSICPGTKPHLHGWHSRRLPAQMGHGDWVCGIRELYCGDCFAEWGWGDDDNVQPPPPKQQGKRRRIRRRNHARMTPHRCYAAN
jgi:hypothetical protein